MLLPAMGIFSQQDTVINGKHYNTVLCYSAFDYKGDGMVTNLIAFGNMKDGKKHGWWTYSLPGGKVLAQGKYRKGYKVRDWYYLSHGEYKNIFWSRYQRISDEIVVKRMALPEVIDRNDKQEIIFRTQPPPVPSCMLFL
jgi:hypothetical protein